MFFLIILLIIKEVSTQTYPVCIFGTETKSTLKCHKADDRRNAFNISKMFRQSYIILNIQRLRANRVYMYQMRPPCSRFLSGELRVEWYWPCGSDFKCFSYFNKMFLSPHCNFIAGRPKAALLFWFFGDFRCGVPLFIVILVVYKYKKR